jgi:phosphate/sulfate permease
MESIDKVKYQRENNYSYRTAILMAAVMNFIGALTFTGVAGTITKDIVDPFKLEN